MLIGELANRTGASRHTIRFYEELGLVPAPHRRDNRYKEYDDSVVARLEAIRALQKIGFTLAEIGGLLGDVEANGARCKSIAPRVQTAKKRIDDEITRLVEARQLLATYFSECSGKGPRAACAPVKRLLRNETKRARPIR
ncbi:MAG: MerR family transcriptional regulator [Candidatus Hydrogenedentota bacterium]